VLLIGATLSPLHRSPREDGFPFSTYPMFAARRSTVLTIAYGLGVRADGTTFSLPSEVVGSAEVLQAVVVYDDAVHHGPAALAALCNSILPQVDVKTVRIVEGTHDAVALLVDDVRGTERVRWSCSK
jgi:hypothetical protein